ncbi:MAG: methyltransferase domain-containing protein [Bacteroidota bacterium]|nr:MAG: methyltransferase domain-containing protein [Bacteroidota bacterium]
MALIEINARYSTLATENCCLSCGGALDYSKPQTGETCLDLGSGRGNDVLRMAEEVGKEGFVYGLDISDGMLQKAESTAVKLGIENVKFIKSELEHIPLEDNSIDLVISNCTINHATDKQKVWNEIFRVLNTNGRFVVSDIYSLQPVPEQYRTDPEAIAECWAGSVTRLEYLDQLAKAGFKKIEILEESAPYKKGAISVCSFTIKGFKTNNCCN